MAIQIAGGLIDFQIGFAIANVIDPQTGAQSPILGQYLYVFALLFLLSTNGHHLLIDGIYNSYLIIPLDKVAFPVGSQAFATHIITVFHRCFSSRSNVFAFGWFIIFSRYRAWHRRENGSAVKYFRSWISGENHRCFYFTNCSDGEHVLYDANHI